MSRRKLSVAEAITAAALIEQTFTVFEQTAPQTVAEIGGRQALARTSHMSCLGPVPQLDVETWQRMSDEYEERRRYGDLAGRHAAIGQRPRVRRHRSGCEDGDSRLGNEN